LLLRISDAQKVHHTPLLKKSTLDKENLTNYRPIFNLSAISKVTERIVLDFSTAHAIGTSLVHSRLDYCNSLYLNLPKTQLNRLQHIQNSLTRAVVAAPRSSPADHILKSLHWLKVPERIEYKIISTTYKLLQFSSPQYLRDTITIQPSRSTRSSDLVTLLRPPVQSRLRITNRSFWHAARQLWNKLPRSLRVPYQSGSSQLPSVLRLQP